MYRNKLSHRTLGWLTVISMGGTAFQLSGCDAGIRAGVITSLGSASETLLVGLNSALFTALFNAGEPDDTGTGGTVTTGDTAAGGDGT